MTSGRHDDFVIFAEQEEFVLWASLEFIRPLTIQPSALSDGRAPIGVDPVNPRRLAYCGEDDIQVSVDGGQHWSTVHWSTVSTGGVDQATKGSP